MAMVRKCDECDTITGVERYNLRWDSGHGQADLCEKHGGLIVAHFQKMGTVGKSKPTRRRGPGLTKVTTVEDIEKQKAAK